MSQRQRKLVEGKVFRDRVIEECVRAAFTYSDEVEARLATLDKDGKEPDGSYILGDPDRSLGQVWAAHSIVRRLRKLKTTKHLQ